MSKKGYLIAGIIIVLAIIIFLVWSNSSAPVANQEPTLAPSSSSVDGTQPGATDANPMPVNPSASSSNGTQ